MTKPSIRALQGARQGGGGAPLRPQAADLRLPTRQEGLGSWSPQGGRPPSSRSLRNTHHTATRQPSAAARGPGGAAGAPRRRRVPGPEPRGAAARRLARLNSGPSARRVWEVPERRTPSRSLRSRDSAGAGGGAWRCHAPRGAGALASRRRRRKRGWCASLPGNGPELGEATAGCRLLRRAEGRNGQGGCRPEPDAEARARPSPPLGSRGPGPRRGLSG